MITYQTEAYHEVIEDLKEILPQHYEEVALYRDKIDLNPDYDFYEDGYYEANSIHFFTARDNGKLVGYVVTMIYPNPHYKDHIYAVNDLLYVLPEYRHTEVAVQMLKQFEQEMKDLGVSVMTMHMKTYKTFEALMDSLEFDKSEYLFTKYIGS